MSTPNAIFAGPVPPPPPRRHLIYTQGGPASAVSDPEVVEREAKARAKRAAKQAARRARIHAARLAQDADDQEDGSTHATFDLGRDQPKSDRWLNRADFRDVLARSSGPRAVALKFFLGRHNRNDWMQKQKDWLPNASLLASAHPWTFDGTRICYCTRQGRFCGLPDFCPRCNLDLRVEPLQCAFAHSFARRPYWHSLVVDYEMKADRAGIWTGPRGEVRALYLPHRGQHQGRFLHACPVLNELFEALCDVLLSVGKYMQRLGLIDGFLAVVEPNLSFWPDPNCPFHWWSGIDHALLPHVHFLVCGQQSLGPEVMASVYDFLQSSLGAWSYANLWFNPVNSQAQIRKWIDYALKPWPVADWYRHARLSACDPNNLNLSFDEIALETCSGLFALVHSPRRAGVLATNSGARCILDPVPPCLTRKELALCKEEKFYLAHETSFWRTMEKRQLRMGRTFRCRNMSHKAALRRMRGWSKSEAGKPTAYQRSV